MVPDREARFDAMLDALAPWVRPGFRVLDLGCGTGSLSERVLRRFAGAHVVAVDFDPVLLRLGRSALGTAGGRLKWVDLDLRSPSWPASLPPGRIDAAVSTTALHWLTGPELTRLYRGLARRIRRGGLFLNGDHLAFSPTSTRFAAAARASRMEPAMTSSPGESWDAWWTSVASEPLLAAELKVRSTRYPRAHQRTPTPDLAGHVARLRRAGFREIEVVWARWENRVLAAVR